MKLFQWIGVLFLMIVFSVHTNAQQNRFTYELGVNYGIHTLSKVKNVKSTPNSFDNIHNVTSLQLDNRWGFNNIKRTNISNEFYYWFSKFNWQVNYIKSFSKKLNGYFSLSGCGRNFIITEYPLDLGTAEPLGLYSNRIALNYYVLSASYSIQSKEIKGFTPSIGAGLSQVIKPSIRNGFYYDSKYAFVGPTINVGLQKKIAHKWYFKINYNQGLLKVFEDYIISQHLNLPQPDGFSTFLVSRGSNVGMSVGFIPNHSYKASFFGSKTSSKTKKEDNRCTLCIIDLDTTSTPLTIKENEQAFVTEKEDIALMRCYPFQCETDSIVSFTLQAVSGLAQELDLKYVVNKGNTKVRTIESKSKLDNVVTIIINCNEIK